jgi:hypothetical protein
LRPLVLIRREKEIEIEMARKTEMVREMKGDGGTVSERRSRHI